MTIFWVGHHLSVHDDLLRWVLRTGTLDSQALLDSSIYDYLSPTPSANRTVSCQLTTPFFNLQVLADSYTYSPTFPSSSPQAILPSFCPCYSSKFFSYPRACLRKWRNEAWAVPSIAFRLQGNMQLLL